MLDLEYNGHTHSLTAKLWKGSESQIAMEPPYRERKFYLVQASAIFSFLSPTAKPNPNWDRRNMK